MRSERSSMEGNGVGVVLASIIGTFGINTYHYFPVLDVHSDNSNNHNVRILQHVQGTNWNVYLQSNNVDNLYC